MDTIREDVDDTNTGSLNSDDATDAFLNRWTDPEEASEGEDGANSKSEDETKTDEEEIENVDEDTDEGAEEDPDDSESEDSKEDKPLKFVEDEDMAIKYTVDGEEKTATIKDLKRLAGQESALTRKSQEVATQRKAADERGAQHLAGLTKLLDRAEEKYKPYAEIDFLVASTQMPKEDFQAVREAALEAYGDVKFLTEELGGFMQELENKRVTAFNEGAKECIAALSDPEKGIPGWGQPMYDELRSYAVKGGMSQEVINQITDPAVFKLLHKAMQYDKIKTVSTKKKATAPKKVLKQKGSIASTKKGTSDEGKSAFAALRAKGDRESAANAFMSRWTSDSDD